MLLNYLAGVVSMVLAVSAFIPWLTVWFYSLKGIESIYGVLILLVGLFGMAVSIFQHLSGKVRGQLFIVFSLISLAAEVLYFRRIATYGSKLNEIVTLVTDILGDTFIQKLQQIVGEQWTKIITKLIMRMGVDTSFNGFDFIGGGLILAVISSFGILILGIMMERNKETEEE